MEGKLQGEDIHLVIDGDGKGNGNGNGYDGEE